jgi:HD-like signal output (HDOD) protein
MTSGTLETRAAQVGALIDRLDETVRGGRLKLPVLPDIATRVREAVAAPHSNAFGLAQIVSSDVSLAARLIKIANSASYAGLSQIKDLHRAIARLGSAMVVAIATGAAGKESFRSKDTGFNEMLASAWKRSLLAAATCRALAPSGGIDREEAFLAGLLHAVGEPVLLDATLDLVNGGMPRPVNDVLSRALEVLGPRAGSVLLASWHVPASVSGAVCHQHDVAGAAPELARAAAVVRIASLFARLRLACTPPTETAAALVADPACAVLGLNATLLDAALEQATDEYEELARIL